MHLQCCRLNLAGAFLYLILPALLLSFDSAAAKPGAAKSSNVPGRDRQAKGWTLEQKHAYLGKMVLHFSQDALKVESQNSGVTLIASGPDWKVTLYNRQRKLFYDMPLATWKRTGMRTTWSMLTNIAEWPIVRVGTSTYASMRTDQFILAADPRAREKIKRGIPVNRAYGKAGDYLVATSLGAPQELGTVVTELYRLPPITGVPVSMTTYHGPHQKHFGLSGQLFKPGETTKILATTECRPDNFPSGFFTLPPGFTRAKDDREVAISPEQKNEMDDLVRDMGLGSDFGK